MKPMEAWSIVSANLAHLVRLRRCQGDPKGFTDAESEAEVITFKALQEMQERVYPKPLTFKDLMGMHGEPVYVTVPGKPHRDKWCIVDMCSPRPGLIGLGYFLDIDIVKTTAVRVYQFKPTEVNEDV